MHDDLMNSKSLEKKLPPFPGFFLKVNSYNLIYFFLGHNFTTILIQ